MSALAERVEAGFQRALSLGGPGTYIRRVKGAYDPATGAQAAPVATQYSVQCALTGLRVGRAEGGALAFHRVALLPAEVERDGIVEALSPQPGDALVAGGREWPIVDVQSHAVEGRIVGHRCFLGAGR